MGQLTEFLDNLQALYEQAEAAIFGDENTSATHNGQTRDSLAKAIKGAFNELQALAQGKLTFETLIELNGFTPTADADGRYPLAEVVADIDENLGLYYYSGSGWLQSPYSNIEVTRTYEAIKSSFVKNTMDIPESVNSEDYAFVVCDDSGRMSWLAVDKNGKLPDFSIEAITQSIISRLSDYQKEITGLDYDAKNLNGFSFYVCDDTGRLSELALTTDGKFSQHTIDALANHLKLANRPPGISCLGDSITFGYGSDNIQWPKLLGDELGLPVWNPSVGGEASGDIALRSGALRAEVTIPSGEIPADTAPVAVTVSPSVGWRNLSGVSETSIGEFEGSLSGIPGVLKRSGIDASWSFSRNTSSSGSLSISDGELFTTQEGKAHRDDIWIIWAGRNNPHTSQILGDVEKMVSFISPNSRYIVLSVLNNDGEPSGSSGYNNIISINEALSLNYPDNYFDIREWLVNDALDYLSLTKTSQDLLDISNDLVPDSLRKDGVHPNENGIRAIAYALRDKINEMGYL